jgi:FkbM family methyltransferase
MAPVHRSVHELLKDARGVIHVGANKGQEAPLYDRYDLPVLWVEADPETAVLLKERIADYPNQTAVCALLSEHPGEEHRFHVADNGGQSSSLLVPKLHTTVWPEVRFTRAVPLISTTLDLLLADLAVAKGQFDILVMDTQGSELLVLKGATCTLASIRGVKAEASDFEAYEGGCKVDELDLWLTSQGFSRYDFEEASSTPGIGSFYEVFYKKDRDSNL